MGDNLTFNISDNNENITLNNSNDPDANFFHNNKIETQCFTIAEAKTHFHTLQSKTFSLLNVNIRSIKKKFEIYAR